MQKRANPALDPQIQGPTIIMIMHRRTQFQSLTQTQQTQVITQQLILAIKIDMIQRRHTIKHPISAFPME